MKPYISKSALVAEIERIKNTEYNGNSISDDVACCALDMVIEAINTLEVKEGKQIIIITESDGNAHIHWDCRSLEDVNILLDCAKSFIIDRQIEEVRGKRQNKVLMVWKNLMKRYTKME